MEYPSHHYAIYLHISVIRILIYRFINCIDDFCSYAMIINKFRLGYILAYQKLGAYQRMFKTSELLDKKYNVIYLFNILFKLKVTIAKMRSTYIVYNIVTRTNIYI